MNTASRLESTSAPGCIHMSEDTYRLVAHLPQYSQAQPCTTEVGPQLCDRASSCTSRCTASSTASCC